MRKGIVIFAIGFVLGIAFEKAGGVQIFTDLYQGAKSFLSSVEKTNKSGASKVDRAVGK